LPTPYTTADWNLAEAARWRALAKQLDDPHDHDSAEVISRYVRRLEALLADEFDGSGRDLAEKVRSVKGRVSRELVAELLAICAMQERAADSLAMEDVSATCDRAVVHLLTEAVDSKPRTADSELARYQWTLRHPALGGLVRKNRKYDDGLQHMAVMDLDGHLIELRTSKIIRMEPGDRVALLRRGKQDATDYYNVTRKIGSEPLSEAATYKFLGAGAAVCILGIAGTVVLLAIRSIHRWGDLLFALKYLVVGIPSVTVACVGFAMLIMGI
jgi:hypothetical protein